MRVGISEIFWCGKQSFSHTHTQRFPPKCLLFSTNFVQLFVARHNKSKHCIEQKKRRTKNRFGIFSLFLCASTHWWQRWLICRLLFSLIFYLVAVYVCIQEFRLVFVLFMSFRLTDKHWLTFRVTHKWWMAATNSSRYRDAAMWVWIVE